jgi:hypothetical protein
MSQLYILVEYTSERNNENFILSVIIKSYTRTIIVSLDQNSLIFERNKILMKFIAHAIRSGQKTSEDL